MSEARVVRVTGTDDPAEIAALLAALQARHTADAGPSAYDRWRGARVAALRASRRHESRSGI